MDDPSTMFLVSVSGFLGALAYVVLAVYPFQYGLVESGLLAAAVTVGALVEFVFDEATFGGS